MVGYSDRFFFLLRVFIFEILFKQIDDISQSPKIIKQILFVDFRSVLEQCLLESIDLIGIEISFLFDSGDLSGGELAH